MDNDKSELGDDLDEMLEGIDASWRKYEQLQDEIDIRFEQVLVLECLSQALNDFSERLQSVEQPLLQYGQGFSSYVKGCFYSATVGAYEVFMHDVIHSVTESDTLFEHAKQHILRNSIDNSEQVNIPKLKEFRKFPSKEEFRKRMYSATLIDAQKVACSVKKWFEINIPTLDDVKEVTLKRNLFSHNGGKNYDGSYEAITVEQVLSLIERLDENVAKAAQAVSRKIDELSKSES